jgi:hypothetical protein
VSPPKAAQHAAARNPEDAMTTTETLAATAALILLAGGAQALPAVGLTGERTLVLFDTDTAAATGTVEVTGVTRLLGIDLRPGTGQVIGVTDTQDIVAIDLATGATTPVATMSAMLPVAGDAPVVVEFNPAADRLRFMSGTANHRVNPDTGEATVDGMLAYLPDDANAEAEPMIAAAAYINSFGKPEATAMYNIDTGLSALVQQAPPNDGTLKTIGALGVTLDGPVGFDVATTADGTNTAWLAANGGIHTVDLATGAVTGSWMLTGTPGPIRDIAVLTAP